MRPDPHLVIIKGRVAEAFACEEHANGVAGQWNEEAADPTCAVVMPLVVAQEAPAMVEALRSLEHGIGPKERQAINAILARIDGK